MAKTQKVNYGNDIALPVAANALFPDRPYGRRGFWVKNQGANVMLIGAPSGSIYKLDAGATLMMQDAGMLEDGPYTITGTAAQTFSFWEAY